MHTVFIKHTTRTLSHTRYAIHATQKCKDTHTYSLSHTEKQHTHTHTPATTHTQRGQVDTRTEASTKAALNQRDEKGRCRPVGPRPSALSFNFSSWSESVAAYL